MPHTLKVNRYRLEELRDTAGIKTDRELAERLNVHPKTLYRIKNGSKIDGNFIAAAFVVLGARLEDSELYRIEPPVGQAA